MRPSRYAFLTGALLSAAAASAQVTPPPSGEPAPPPAPQKAPPAPATPTKSVPYGAGMKINISPDGSKFIRFITWHQVWMRYTENNAGTLRAPGKPQDSQFDVGIRRSRLVLLAQLNPRFIIYTHMGINNQSVNSGGVSPAVDGKKPQFFIHEAVTEYKSSTPLSLGTTTGTTNRGTNVAAYNPQGTRAVYQGYANYNFFESESNQLPYFTGTYLGSKKVLAVGAGFMYNKDAMYSRSTSSAVTTVYPTGTNLFDAIPTDKHSIKIYSADVFLDMPLDTAKSTALTVYGAYYHEDFGPNYVRFVGALNPGYGTAATRGNAIPQSGTGSSQYLQVGYLLPKNTLGPKARLQPYLTYLHSSYEGLRDASGDRKQVHVPNAGINLLLDGHNAKITLDYRHRPDFTNPSDLKYRPELTLQTQVYL